MSEYAKENHIERNAQVDIPVQPNRAGIAVSCATLLFGLVRFAAAWHKPRPSSKLSLARKKRARE
jgi:hypothetical protein